MLLWTSRSVGDAKRIRIWNRNLQTKITVFLYAPTLLLVHRGAVFKIFFIIYFFTGEGQICTKIPPKFTIIMCI